MLSQRREFCATVLATFIAVAQGQSYNPPQVQGFYFHSSTSGNHICNRLCGNAGCTFSGQINHGRREVCRIWYHGNLQDMGCGNSEPFVSAIVCRPAAATTTLPPTRVPSQAPSTPPSRAPTASPTAEPTAAPTRHACNDGSHGCDTTAFGICEQIGSGADHRCSCLATHHCVPDCETASHTCEWNTLSPTDVPTRPPSPAPTTVDPTAVPTRRPTAAPTAAPSRIPTASTPTRSPSAMPSTFPSFSPIAEPTSAPTDAGGGGGGGGGNPRVEPNGRNGSASTVGDSGSSDLTVVLVVVITVVVLLGVGLGALLYVNRLTVGSNKREVLAFSNPHYDTGVVGDERIYNDFDPAPGAADSGYMDVAATPVVMEPSPTYSPIDTDPQNTHGEEDV